MTETIRWYAAAGFEVRDRFPGDNPTWCEVARDGVILQFHSGDTPWLGAPMLTGCLYLYPPSVTAVAEELQGHVDLPFGVEVREWGRRESVVQDPNGYYLTFAEDL